MRFPISNKGKYTPLLDKANSIFERSYKRIGGDLSDFKSYAAMIESPLADWQNSTGVEYLPVDLLETSFGSSTYAQVMQAYILEYVPRHEGFELSLIDGGVSFPECHLIASVFAREDLVGCSSDFLKQARSAIPQGIFLGVPLEQTPIYHAILHVSEKFSISFSKSCGVVLGGDFGEKSYIVKEIESNAHTPGWQWDVAKNRVKKI